MGDDILAKIRELQVACKAAQSTGRPTRELALVITKLEEAEMWRIKDNQLRSAGATS